MDVAQCLEKMAHQLEKKKRIGIREVLWTLTPAQYKFVTKNLGYHAEVSFYEILTTRIDKARRKAPILQTVHRNYIKGKKRLYRSLQDEEIQALERAQIVFRPFKYRILLTEDDT